MMVTASEHPVRLVSILRALPEAELRSLASRVGAHIDPSKRVDAPVQLARVLVSSPEILEPTRLPLATAQLLRRLTESGGRLGVSAVPSALEPLAARGIVFAHVDVTGGLELILPAAYQVQVPPWESEDPRGLRALIAQASTETQTAIATHYLGKPAIAPIALALEAAWEVLSSASRLAPELDGLATIERRLLEAIEHEGGEVDTEELLDLEREPLRIRGAMGPTPSRRGGGFSLERRGMLMPVHPNRHVIPTEVAAIVGQARVSRCRGKREQVRAFVLDGDHEPRRARFALDPGPLALALALAAREGGLEVREGAGTPRSMINRMGQRFGREPEAVALIVALSRALGMWDTSGLSRTVPPGSRHVGELSTLLFATWRKGGAWDEARTEAEVLRIPSDSRDPSPVGVVRDIVLDALGELGEGRWVPWEAIADFVRTDPRTPGVNRLLRRWAERVGVEPSIAAEVARRITLETLPYLGVLDVGECGNDEDIRADLGPLVRITRRGRGMLLGESPPTDWTPSSFVDQHVLRVGTSATIGSVLSLLLFADIGQVCEHLELSITGATLTRAVSVGLESQMIRASLEAIAAIPVGLAKSLEQMGLVLGQGAYVLASAFLWCDSVDIREMLRTRRQTADLFLDPSPPGGLLVAPGKDLDTVARKCRTLGVEVIYDGQVVRAQSTIPPRKSDRPAGRQAMPSGYTERLAALRRKLPPAG